MGQYRGKNLKFFVLSEYEKAYIAGFLDGDGCIMFQLVHRKDYAHGYQVRASIVFYQKAIHRDHLVWLKSKFGYGYIRIRNDDMAEYTIVGLSAVIEVLKHVGPYLRLKKAHVILARKIASLLPRYHHLDRSLLLKVSGLVDQFGKINYSKRRRNTTETLNAFFSKMDSP